MDFGDAVRALKAGKRVCRAGWNGRKMFLFIVPSNEWALELESMENIAYPLSAFIAMKTADDKIVPWLCSQTDALAEDWETVNP